jgi:hypothetical protein
MKNYHSFLLLALLLPSLALAQGAPLDSAFSNQIDLSDQEMDNAQKFDHQGIKARTIEEGCKDKKALGCKPVDDGFPLEKLIGVAYTTLGMISGGSSGPTLNKKKVKTTEAPVLNSEGKQVKPEKETRPDYCIIAATAYETLGGMIQQALQSKANNTASGAGDAQLQALISLKETHLARRKTASFQRAIYGGVTLCYVAMIASGAAVDAKLLLKMGGAGALTGLYWKKAAKHKNAAEAVQLVINSLPQAGTCNPWTRTPCFCSEPTSKTLYPAQYQEVCVLNNGNFDVPKVVLGCAAVAGNNLQYDKECKCKQNNTCLKSNLKAYNPNFSLANNLMNEANKTFDLLNSGDFDQGKLDRASINSASLAAKMKIKPEEKLPQPKLSADQQKMADALKEFMPASVANLAATSAPGSYIGGISDAGMESSAIDKLLSSVKAKLAEVIKVDYKKGRGNTNYGSTEPDFVMPKFPGQEGPKVESTEILSFAEQAISKADVSNAPETPIFDIISNRYRRSGWKKLEGEKE